MSEGTQVAKRVQFPPDVEQRIAENKAKNAVAAAIRGQTWSKDLGPDGVRALAEYCRQNSLDPVRHIEVLGGRPYLTATLYEERAAPLIRAGVLIPHEPEFINTDARLDKLEAAGDAWAAGENMRRMRLRIEHNAPEKAAAICIYRVTVRETGQTVVGVNWCGGGVRQRDPVGDAEPTKTAITRAGRRAWKQIADAVPMFGEQFAQMEQTAAPVVEAVTRDVALLAAETPVFSGARVGMSLAPADIGDDTLPIPEGGSVRAALDDAA